MWSPNRARVWPPDAIRRPLLAASVCAAGAAALLVRIVPDVHTKGLHEDEALAALTAARSFDELLRIVLVDRGGAPLHFALAHAAIAVNPSAEAIRWISVLSAVGTIPVAYDLVRRLATARAAAVAALLAASSQLLAVYGSFGRMYALLAFVSTLAADLFVRAVQHPGAGTAAAGAAAAWLVPATHPYGAMFIVVEGFVGLFLWRGRPLRPALPALACCLAMIPFAFADLRLAERFSVGTGTQSIASRFDAVRFAVRAFGGIAGGKEPIIVLVAGVALIGVITLIRARNPFAAFALLTLTVPFVLLAVIPSNGGLAARLSTRHFLFEFPFWIALVSVGIEALASRLGRVASLSLVAALVAAAFFAPWAVPDPRGRPSSQRQALEAPADWLESEMEPGSALFPNSPAFLAALPVTRTGAAIPREHSTVAERAVRSIALPAPALLVAIPLDDDRVDTASLTRKLGGGYAVGEFPHWLLVRTPGPLSSTGKILREALTVVRTARSATPRPSEILAAWYGQSIRTLSGAARAARAGGLAVL
jgi:Dolichyl-phosphate-mannose-protein mannosyltransferase